MNGQKSQQTDNFASIHERMLKYITLWWTAVMLRC